MDVDILYNRSPENISKLFTFLRLIAAIYHRPNDKAIEPKEEDFGGMGHGLFTTRLGPLDILTAIEKGQTYEELLDHTVEIEFRGYTIRVLDLKMLIKLNKRLSSCPMNLSLWLTLSFLALYNFLSFIISFRLANGLLP